MMRNILLFLVMTVRVAGAVDYVDCTSSDIVTKINACRSKYILPSTNDSAAICGHYASYSTCVPGVCCSDFSYALALAEIKSTLVAKKIQCDTGCDDKVKGTESCESVATMNVIYDCKAAVRSAYMDTTCAYYVRMASCVPSACCNAGNYAPVLARDEAKLNSLALPNCNMVCGASLSLGARVMGSMQAVMFVALTAVLFIETK